MTLCHSGVSSCVFREREGKGSSCDLDQIMPLHVKLSLCVVLDQEMHSTENLPMWLKVSYQFDIFPIDTNHSDQEYQGKHNKEIYVCNIIRYIWKPLLAELNMSIDTVHSLILIWN